MTQTVGKTLDQLELKISKQNLSFQKLAEKVNKHDMCLRKKLTAFGKDTIKIKEVKRQVSDAT